MTIMAPIYSNTILKTAVGVFAEHWLIVVAIVVVLHLAKNKFQPTIWKIPGPTAAAYTGLWRFLDVARGQAHLTAVELHRKHGNLVRVGPRHVSIGDGKEISNIYSLKGGFTKTAFYPVFSFTWRKKVIPNLFGLRDEKLHKELLKPVANLYSLKSILSKESSVDDCTKHLFSKFSTGGPVDLGKLLHLYAYDVVGEITFSKRLGFLDEGKDITDLITANSFVVKYMSAIGQIPALHKFLLGNPALPHLFPQMEGTNKPLTFTVDIMNNLHANASQLDRDGELEAADRLHAQGDFLARIEAMKLKDPNKFSTEMIVSHAVTNVSAGSDTTSAAMGAVFYYLLHNPEKMHKLVAEIDKEARDGRLSDPIQFREAYDYLPYLNAVIKEAMRLQPSIGMMLEREVPSGGAEICGQYMPEGTIVGINAWVVGRDPEVYPNPESFTPERWLESSPEQLRLMERNWFVFGGGTRTCVGQHISTMEMMKIIPQLLKAYEITFDKAADFQTWNSWFMFQKGLVVRLRHR